MEFASFHVFTVLRWGAQLHNLWKSTESKHLKELNFKEILINIAEYVNLNIMQIVLKSQVFIHNKV